MASATGRSEHCSKVATRIFEHRFASNFIEITTADASSFDILKHFGHLISHLTLHLIRFGNLCTANEITKYRNLLQYASHYGRNSVTNLRILYNENCANTHYDVDILNGIKSSFSRVEIASINLNGATIKTNNIRLNKIIPNVHHLELNFESLSDSNFIGGEYQYLDKLSISGRLLDESYDKNFKNLLLENPHIRSVSMIRPAYQIFHHLKKYAKNLDEIEIQRSIRGERLHETIHFSNVKKFVLRFDNHECHPLKGITFGPELNELVLECQEQNDEYIDTLFTYRQIEKLSTGKSKLNDRNLLKMIGEFSALIEAKFSFHNDVTVDSIAKFIRSSKALNMLSFWHISKSKPEEFLNQLKTRIDDNFEIVLHRNKAQNNGFFAIQRKAPINCATKQIGFDALILIFAAQISCAFSFI